MAPSHHRQQKTPTRPSNNGRHHPLPQNSPSVSPNPTPPRPHRAHQHGGGGLPFSPACNDLRNTPLHVNNPFAPATPTLAYNGAHHVGHQQHNSIYASPHPQGSSATLVVDDYDAGDDSRSLLKSKSKGTTDGEQEGDMGERYNLLLRSPGPGGGRQRRIQQAHGGGDENGARAAGLGGSEWSRRQTLPKRGPTRKVKLTHGKNFVVEYAVPTAVRNAVEGKWAGGERFSPNLALEDMRYDLES